ncbi:MAG: rane-associated metal-dependent phosphohydrolase, HDc [Acidobacteria bacterium]|nr:rane-associated metal-dependent phosphohydrolase, HDc [Acidobacteriota bacterium]
MPAVAKIGKRERNGHSLLRDIYWNLRSHLTWRDLLIGFGAASILSILLLGSHYQSIPDYKIGDIARETIRAPQDMVYQDRTATALEREIARERTPAVYDFDGVLTARIESDIKQAFDMGRNFLAENQVPPKTPLSSERKAELLNALEPIVGRALPSSILPLLLDQRFSTLLEGRLIRIFDTVMRGCIVDNQGWSQFLRDERRGILIRDNATRQERNLSEAYLTRNHVAARDYLKQFSIEFPDLSQRDRTQLIGFLTGLLVPNLMYNPAETERSREAAANLVPPVEIHIEQGKTILRRGEVVTPAALAELSALRNLRRPRLVLGQFAGFFLFVAGFFYGLWRYLVYYEGRRSKIRHRMLLILLVTLVVFTLIRLLTALVDILGEQLAIEAFRGPYQLYYLIPFAAAAILVTLLVGINLGMITSMLVAALAGLFYGDIYIAAYAMLGSMGGMYGVRQYKERAAVLKAGLTVGLVNIVGVLGIWLLRQAPMSLHPTLLAMVYGFLGGPFAAAVASMLLPTLESLFRITTDIRLLELSNLNAPMLRRLAVEAPGTYHHSLMVATLGEAAAEAVGANSLIVRVGAYYHDLGKVLKPEYFTENQAFGINKHEALSPNMSCLVIASHVKDGLELAKEAGLAEGIRDLIPQHHGTRIMTYFYRKALDSMNEKSQEIDEEDFRYPGPKPQSKEAAILMMADSVEAASRTLSDPSPAQIGGMIDRLIDSILEDNQCDECDITFREIRLVKESFFKILSGLYHRRLDYPGYDFKSVAEKSDRNLVANSSSKHAKAV